MRESKTFAERTPVRSSDETVKKYFLVYEGSDTEVIYFDAVNNFRNQIGINPLIEFVPLIRSFGEEGWRNTKKIVDRVINNLEESKSGRISYESMLNRIMDYFLEENIITTRKTQATSIWRILVWICEEKLHKKLMEEVGELESDCHTLIEAIRRELDMTNIVSDISEIIKRGEITYSEGFDKICLIVDRDRKSFFSDPQNNQYEYVLNKCIENKFGFYVTNPCFEFWLLLHFDKVHEINKNELIVNRKVNSKRTFAEQELRKVFPGYKKTSYNASALVKNIDKAVANEQKFCEDKVQLESKLGSNVGLLITEMKK